MKLFVEWLIERLFTEGVEYQNLDLNDQQSMKLTLYAWAKEARPRHPNTDIEFIIANDLRHRATTYNAECSKLGRAYVNKPEPEQIKAWNDLVNQTAKMVDLLIDYIVALKPFAKKLRYNKNAWRQFKLREVPFSP